MYLAIYWLLWNCCVMILLLLWIKKFWILSWFSLLFPPLERSGGQHNSLSKCWTERLTDLHIPQFSAGRDNWLTESSWQWIFVKCNALGSTDRGSYCVGFISPSNSLFSCTSIYFFFAQRVKRHLWAEFGIWISIYLALFYFI